MSEILTQNLNQNYALVLYTAGVGAQAMSHFTLHPGSSKYALESASFYAKGSLESLLDRKIEKFVSEEVAEDMALKALSKAHEIARKDNMNQSQLLGVGITGAVASVSPRQGRHHAYICLHFGNKRFAYHINLTKGVRTREQEDSYISEYLFYLIIKHCNQQADLEKEQLIDCTLTLLKNDENLAIIDLLSQKPQYFHSILFKEDHYYLNPNIENAIVLSGSFNPIHEGHIDIMQEAAKLFNVQDQFLELSIVNADKGSLSYQEVLRRIQIIKDRKQKVLVSNKPLFKDKTTFLKNCIIAVGIDTFLRLTQVKYYNDSVIERDISFFQIIQKNNKIVVAPRFNEKTQKMENLSDLEIPPLFQKYVTEIKSFRNDQSSTKIRQVMQ